jgi:hypothetical protein
MGKIELKFWQIIFYMKDRAYVMVYGDGIFFKFFAIVPDIPSPKHREIQELCQNYRISAIIFIYLFIFRYGHID